MDNIVAVTGHLRARLAATGQDPARQTLTVVPTRSGAAWHRADDGSVWRAYHYIEDTVSYQQAGDAAVFGAAGQAFGRFAGLLGDFPAQSLHVTIAGFHDTPARYRGFEAALAADPLGRARTCRPEIAAARAHRDDCAVLVDQLQSGRLGLRVTHNDTKLNNILMDPRRPEAVCVIDLDTVMPGLVAHDFGDAIRFGANTAAEDEPDISRVHLSLPLVEAYTAGFMAGVGPVLTDAEIDSLVWGARLMTLECGLRFLADYLAGDTYFHIQRPGHNLDRARTQFALLAQLEAKADVMAQIVARHAPGG
jgi:Ser/Thr protein kinase RdoA (MazF antagonist)